ncbi:MAG: hypothetical protein K5871_00030 [Lachnospiraceae bacterium]|nr:hypothetical protein [Lachnospiraceae bacterium]
MSDFLSLVKVFLFALILTIVIEELIALLLGARKKTEFVIVALVNTLTNPLVMLYYTLAVRYFPFGNRIIIQLPAEILVVITESCIYHYMGTGEKYSFRHPVLLALAANLASWLTGLALQSGGIFV